MWRCGGGLGIREDVGGSELAGPIVGQEQEVESGVEWVRCRCRIVRYASVSLRCGMKK